MIDDSFFESFEEFELRFLDFLYNVKIGILFLVIVIIDGFNDGKLLFFFFNKF